MTHFLRLSGDRSCRARRTAASVQSHGVARAQNGWVPSAARRALLMEPWLEPQERDVFSHMITRECERAAAGARDLEALSRIEVGHATARTCCFRKTPPRRRDSSASRAQRARRGGAPRRPISRAWKWMRREWSSVS